MNKDKNAIPALPSKVGLSLVLAPILVAVGWYAPSLLQISQVVQPFDPWNKPEYGVYRWLLTPVMLIITGFMFIKQWHYYYGGNGKKDGVFAKTVGALSDEEFSLDILLSVLGGILVFLSLRMPSLWLMGFSVYCILGWRRCRVTLLRQRFAKTWRTKGVGKVSLWTFCFSNYPGRATAANFEEKLKESESTLDKKHISNDGTELPVNAILAGWVWSFALHAIYAALGNFLIWCLLLQIGTNWISFSVTLLFVMGVGILFWKLSETSLKWGKEHYKELV